MAAGERLTGSLLRVALFFSAFGKPSAYYYSAPAHHAQQSTRRTTTTRERPVSNVVGPVSGNGNGNGGKFTSTALSCQLLGMNSRGAGLELNMRYVWPSFCERGGQTDVHADGWGLAYYHGGGHGLRQFHDVEAASTSPLARFLTDPAAPIRTTNMMAHIRFATTGSVDLANVHPFSREYVCSALSCNCQFGGGVSEGSHISLNTDRIVRAATYLSLECGASISRSVTTDTSR
jgi:Glutamine amidotransferases class-II